MSATIAFRVYAVILLLAGLVYFLAPVETLTLYSPPGTKIEASHVALAKVLG